MTVGLRIGGSTRARSWQVLAAAAIAAISLQPGVARADDAMVAVDQELPDGWIEFIEDNPVHAERLPVVVSRVDSGTGADAWWDHVVGGLVPAVRFGGRNRGETARLIAVNQTGYAAGFGDDASTAVIVARDDQYPDALAASYLAGHAAAPVVLTNSDSITPNFRQALNHWGGPGGVDIVYVLGGTAAISQGVEDELVADGYTVKRLSGGSRSATAAAIAGEFGPQGVGVDGDGRRTAIVASGSAHVDALVAGPLAAARRFPLLLTAPGALSEATAQALKDLGIQRVLLAGGPAAVSAAVESEIGGIVGVVDRVAGATRFETAVAFAGKAVDEFGFNSDHVGLVTGGDFPDALGLAPHAGLGAEGAFPVLLGGTTLPTATREYFEEIASCGFRALHIAGGTGAISAAQKDEAREALTDFSDGCSAVVLNVASGSATVEDDNGLGKARLVFGPGESEMCYGLIAWISEESVVSQDEMVTGSEGWVVADDGEELVALDPPEDGWAFGCVEVDEEMRDAILDDPQSYLVRVLIQQ